MSLSPRRRSEREERDAVVAAAYSWLRTPYRHMGRVKGAGVDCATLLAESYAEAGLIENPEIAFYSPQWHLTRSTERYLDFVRRYARETDAPLPGDIVMWRFGRAFSHGAIVVRWPLVIHSYVGIGCVLEDAEAAAWLTTIGENGQDQGKPRPRIFMTHW